MPRATGSAKSWKARPDFSRSSGRQPDLLLLAKSEYVEDTRLSEYYWVEDLQKIAQKQPAIPRSPKKRRVSECRARDASQGLDDSE